VYWRGEFWSPAAFQDEARDRSDCNGTVIDFSAWRSFLRLLVLIGGGGFLVLTVAAIVVLRWRRRDIEV